VKASKRNPGPPDEWFRQKIHLLRQNPEVGNRLEEITARQNGTWQGQDCSHELITLACLAVSRHQGRPAVLEKVWAAKTGKTWKALRQFPQQLIRMADEVERINDGDPVFFARTPEWNVDRHKSCKLSEDCEQLPGILRAYAKALSERNAFVVRATPRKGSLKALLDLSDMVKLLTGSYHDREVAELLNVAADVCNEGQQFDALSVAQSRSRRRKRTAKT
jgi:hypothetical protein